MFKVEVVSADTFTRNVTSKKTGEHYVFIEQGCYVHVPGEPHPLKSRLTLPKGQTQGYAPGFYRTSDDSVRVDQYGEITVKLSKLIALAAVAGSPASKAA